MPIALSYRQTKTVIRCRHFKQWHRGLFKHGSWHYCMCTLSHTRYL